MTIKIKNYLFLALWAVSFGSIAYGMSDLEKPTQAEVRQVQDYLADALEKARAGQFDVGKIGTIELEFKNLPGIADIRAKEICLKVRENPIASIVFMARRNHGKVNLMSVANQWRNNGIAPYLLAIAGIELIEEGCINISGHSVPKATSLYRRFGAQSERDKEQDLSLDAKEILPNDQPISLAQLGMRAAL